MAYSQGYHPKPRVSFGPALPVGVESSCEFMDFELVGSHDAGEVGSRLSRTLPPGLRVEEARLLNPRAPSISASQRAVHYLVEFTEGWSQEALLQRILAFEAKPEASVSRPPPPKGVGGKRSEKIAQTKAREIDLKHFVTHLALEGANRVAFSLKADPSGTAKPAEVLAAIFGDGVMPQGVKVLKEGVSFERAFGNRRPVNPSRAPRYLDA